MTYTILISRRMELKKWHYLLLIILLVFAFFKTFYSIHSDYRFPYHQDEWQHLGISIQAMEEGYNKEFNPFLGVEGWHADLESGFHLFLSNLFILTGANPILNYQYLAAIFSVITGFIVFLCTYRLTDKFYAGILSLIIFISLKSNINILGKDYFVPLTMALPFIFLFILYFLTSLKEKNYKKIIFSITILAVLLLIHPPSSVILIFPVFIELLFNLDFIKQGYKKLKLGVLLIPILVGIFFLLLWKGEWQATLGYLSDLLVFEQGWGKEEVTYFLPSLYGWVVTLFAIYGFTIANKMKLKFFLIFAFFSLGMTAFFNVFGFSVLVPYSRVIHYAMLALIPLSAFGILSVLYLVNKQFERNEVVHLLVSFILLAIVLNSQYKLDLEYKKYGQSPIDENDYRALIWLKQNFGSDNTLITPYLMTSAVYPISGNKVISLIPSQMGGGLIEKNLDFYKAGCNEKKAAGCFVC